MCIFHFGFDWYSKTCTKYSFSHRWPLLGAIKQAPKKLKNIFFHHEFYSLKAHAHYFTVPIYLATWRAAKVGIFTHFTSINLLRCSQDINSLMYVYYTDSQLFFMNPWWLCPSRDYLIALLRTSTTTPKKLLPPDSIHLDILHWENGLERFCIMEKIC